MCGKKSVVRLHRGVWRLKSSLRLERSGIGSCACFQKQHPQRKQFCDTTGGAQVTLPPSAWVVRRGPDSVATVALPRVDIRAGAETLATQINLTIPRASAGAAGDVFSRVSAKEAAEPVPQHVMFVPSTTRVLFGPTRRNSCPRYFTWLVTLEA